MPFLKYLFQKQLINFIMINFFRRIRQNMIEANKTSKYLLYAFGEIVLVVIGILIALQINNWKEDTLERQEEYYVLKSLVIDLNNDVELLELNIKNTNDRRKKIDTIFKILANPSDKDIFKFTQLQFELMTDDYFISNRGTYDEGVSSGKLKFIKNNHLREAIFDYYRTVSNSRNDDNLQYKVTNEFLMPILVEEVLSTKQALEFFWGEKSQLPYLNLNELAKNKRYYQALIYTKGDVFQVDEWEYYKRIALELKQEIEGELQLF
ncbi:hypothetical protein D7030_06175 [Flavobacteriaceae bacterium AU392]|nr:hypothetical protein D1817_02245 [Flavobacteriaceae bacterium]RKM84720.1 hypothetical protein D7030_06175 [Flavobacteriaceae bacterium AU392]